MQCLSLEKVRAETPGATRLQEYCGACKALPHVEQRRPCHALGSLECFLPGKHLCCEVSCSGAKCCCCHWATPSSRPFNMGSTLWSRTFLKACPTSKHFILTSRISSGWTGESWEHNLGLCQLKFCHCRGLAEAAPVPVIPPCQPLSQRHCWNCSVAVKTGRAENCLWPQGCCSWKYFKYFL